MNNHVLRLEWSAGSIKLDYTRLLYFTIINLGPTETRQNLLNVLEVL